MHGTAYEIRRPHYLARIRSDIGAALRREAGLVEQPTPPNLMELLRELEARVRRDTTRERLFVDVDACIADLLRAVGREPQEVPPEASRRAA
jgi:hypothetical protein